MAWEQPKYPSSNILSVDTEGDDLLVRFKSGWVYRYPGQAGFGGELLGAKSPGSWLMENLGGKHGERFRAESDKG